jgi:hypothetical protein
VSRRPPAVDLSAPSVGRSACSSPSTTLGMGNGLAEVWDDLISCRRRRRRAVGRTRATTGGLRRASHEHTGCGLVLVQRRSPVVAANAQSASTGPWVPNPFHVIWPAYGSRMTYRRNESTSPAYQIGRQAGLTSQVSRANSSLRSRR